MESFPHTAALLNSISYYELNCDETLTIPSFREQLIEALTEDGINTHRSSSISSWLWSQFYHISFHSSSSSEEHRFLEDAEDVTFKVLDFSLVLVCIICAGLASGLTQGLLSLDPLDLEIKIRSGSNEEKKYASKLLPIISQHHLLLVTLMLWNASAAEALPIFLDNLVPEWVAIIISVTLILLIGEIIPASILTGPRQLQISASLTPLVYIILVLFFPLAYPLAKCLDYIIGKEEVLPTYTRKELSTMLQIQSEASRRKLSESVDLYDNPNNLIEDLGDNMMDEEEAQIIDGALKFKDLMVIQVMTVMENVFSLSIHETLSYQTMYSIFKSGYSRIPIFDQNPNHIVGLILTKDLIFVDPQDETSLKNFVDLFGRQPIIVQHNDRLGETLARFRKDRSHMAIVQEYEEDKDQYRVIGIITLEDIVEQILGTAIEDETDVVSHNYEQQQEENEASPVPTRDADLARLQTLNNAISDSYPSEEEVKSVSIYLFTNVPQIQRMYHNNLAGLQQLVRSSKVMSLSRRTAPGQRPCTEDMLYRRGKMSNFCTLVLTGSVKVLQDGASSAMNPTDITSLRVDGEMGQTDAERSVTSTQALRSKWLTTQSEIVTKGAWSIIAVDALTAPEGSFIPDFTAYIGSEEVRFLRISNYTRDPQFYHKHNKVRHALKVSGGKRSPGRKSRGGGSRSNLQHLGEYGHQEPKLMRMSSYSYQDPRVLRSVVMENGGTARLIGMDTSAHAQLTNNTASDIDDSDSGMLSSLFQRSGLSNAVSKQQRQSVRYHDGDSQQRSGLKISHTQLTRKRIAHPSQLRTKAVRDAMHRREVDDCHHQEVHQTNNKQKSSKWNRRGRDYAEADQHSSRSSSPCGSVGSVELEHFINNSAGVVRSRGSSVGSMSDGDNSLNDTTVRNPITTRSTPPPAPLSLSKTPPRRPSRSVGKKNTINKNVDSIVRGIGYAEEDALQPSVELPSPSRRNMPINGNDRISNNSSNSLLSKHNSDSDKSGDIV